MGGKSVGDSGIQLIVVNKTYTIGCSGDKQFEQTSVSPKEDETIPVRDPQEEDDHSIATSRVTTYQQ